MPVHKFEVGQKVRLTNDLHPAAPGDYEVLAQLPPDFAGECQYRIRSERETHERVTPESRLVSPQDGTR